MSIPFVPLVLLVLGSLLSASPGAGKAPARDPGLSGPPVPQAERRGVIPLCPGLTIVTAINQSDGDYESIKRVMGVDAKAITLAYASERMVAEEFGDVPVLKSTRVNHTVRMEDHGNAPMYLVVWTEDMPNVVPGTTSLGPSRAVFEKLKATGKAELTLIRYVMPGVTLDKSKLEYIFNGKVTYLLTRDPKPTTFPVIVNGKLTQLPALRATGDTFGDKVEFFFLDDPANPIALKFRLGIGVAAEFNKIAIEATGKPAHPSDDKEVLQVVRISYSCGGHDIPLQGVPGKSGTQAAEGGDLLASLERALEKKGQSVDIYDIFFSFNSATIRPESEPTLATLAALMKRHPDWKLSVGGHTDAIGGDAFNQQLSQRRAEAVKAALGTRGVAGARLTTQGFGKSRPRDSNDTLEGRARNRRVELVRQ